MGPRLDEALLSYKRREEVARSQGPKLESEKRPQHEVAEKQPHKSPRKERTTGGHKVSSPLITRKSGTGTAHGNVGGVKAAHKASKPAFRKSGVSATGRKAAVF